MAFPSASGYGNLPNGVFSPVVYSKKVIMFLKKRVVANEITNTEFEGEISMFGDTVRIIKQPVITVADYTRGQTLQTQDIVDSDITMTIDQAKYFQYAMDDIESRHEHVSFEDMAADAAAYALRDNYDQNILAAISAGVASANSEGTGGSPKTVGFGSNNDYTPLDVISRLARLLNEANVPSDNRWLVASPAFFEALRREDSKLIEVQVTGDSSSIVRNEKLGTSLRIHGFTLYESNNAPTASGNPVILAGHKMATATASSILKSESIRNPNSFGDIYRGLFVFGRKVIRPEALAKMTITLGDV